MADESITKAELVAAFRRVKIMVGRPGGGPSSYVGSRGLTYGLAYGDYNTTHELATYPDSLAGELFADAKRHREPEYKEGKVYRDADDDVYQYDVKFDGTKRWYEPGNNDALPFTEPTRPLTYLG